MKKGCLGCLGIGCVTVIIVTVIAVVWGYYLITTGGRTFAVEALNQLGNEIAKEVFEKGSAAEIASLTAELKQDALDGKLGIIDSFKFIRDNKKETERLQGSLILITIYGKLTGKITGGSAPDFVDPEGAEAVRTIVHSFLQDKIEGNDLQNFSRALSDDEKVKRLGGESEDFGSAPSSVKRKVSKEEMHEVVEAIKQYVKDKNLETPPSDMSVDSAVKEEVISFLKKLRGACTTK